ncbi:MAG: PQQ-binding-like beta-propeller repeat protein [bacterium]|nr:PQQ-binding-like beta-propeller repeat protein [bacterium]
MILLSGALPADDRPTTAPGATSRPSNAKIAEARALLARTVAPAKLSNEKIKHIKELITRLGSPVWKVREKASNELLEAGPEILPLLNEAAGHKDIEVSDRVGAAINTIQAKVEDIGIELDPAINILASIGDKKLIDMLLQLMDHASVTGRYTAEYAMRRLTGQNFGFNSRDEPAKRLQAATKWKNWWKDARAKFSYDHSKIKARSVALLFSHYNSRIVSALDIQGKLVWSKNMRTAPYCATGTSNGNILVGYSSGKNIEEYNPQGKLVWSPTGVPNAAGGVSDISRLANGNTLIVYTYRGHVTEINNKGKVVWQKTGLRHPISAQRLKNGNTLIAELSGSRVIEVDRKGKIVWQKTGLKTPRDAVKLPNGNVLIGEWGSKRVMEVNRAGTILWQRKYPTSVFSMCRLPDGNIVISTPSEGVVLLGPKGKKIRQLLGSWGKIRLVPATVLKRRPG